MKLRLIVWILGGILLLCGVVPLVYGIFNFGTFVLSVLGIFVALIPWLWKALAVAPRLRLTVAVCFGVFVLYCVGMSSLMAYKAWFDKPPATGEAVLVVLGAKVNGDEPSLMLRRRLNKAYDYMRDNPEVVCIVTGGQGADEEYPEADVMARYLLGRGIEEERILRESASTSTRENFLFAAAVCRDSGYPMDIPVIVVTDSFHQMRAFLFARSAFPEAENYYALSSYTPWGLFPSYWVRDMFGIIVAWLQTM
ncbi:YdcF family protein [Ruminococcaceae bacterium OttesenSCG-928-L11]|nr:YdcF family protein [Ruminococcaceae bacterium OttesenSCG-928-L11]